MTPPVHEAEDPQSAAQGQTRQFIAVEQVRPFPRVRRRLVSPATTIFVAAARIKSLRGRDAKPLAQLIVPALFGMTTPGPSLAYLMLATLRGNFWIAVALLRPAV